MMPATLATPEMTYDAFLASKRVVSEPVGFAVDHADLHPQLFPFQRDIVAWAIRRGRAAIFADCGLGKTLMQLEWAKHVRQHTGGNLLILAPLAVAAQTAREGEKLGVEVTVCRTGADVRPGITITNYERLHHFDPAGFAGIVLDESSILKAFDGTTRKQIEAFASGIHYRLACTATPAPNDLIEITNHAEFLDVMRGKEIVALFFTQDGNTTHKWRLKGHATQDFWRWMASWSVAIRTPSDLGYPDDDFVLPPLTMHPQTVAAPAATETLFPVEALTLQERQRARRESVADRVAATADLVNASDEQWLVWCDLNAESDALRNAIPDAVDVRGSDTLEHKEQAILDFAEGRCRVLVSKPSICGFGVNLQRCHHVAFVGLSDSYEQQYQAIRRVWRFGQQHPVHVHVVTAETEGAVVQNIRRKERQAAQMMEHIVTNTDHELAITGQHRDEMEYREDIAIGTDWTLYLGDAVERIRELETESVGLTVSSPPFPGMYAYTNSAHDMGNTEGLGEMIEHFRFLIPDLLRITMPGRLCCLHLMQLTAKKSRDGYIGVKDYRGRVIDAMEQGGFHYAGEVTIDKNPQVQATRNKERGLLFKSLATDSSVMRMALADYLLYFRKPGDNPVPIQAGISTKYNGGAGWITEREWIEWAAPVWYRQTKGFPGGIRETDVLNVAAARESDDERHLCPLQRGVVERAIKLWSNPGETVFDPFNGVGTVGDKALELNRRYAGIELKESYFTRSIENLNRAVQHRAQGMLFDTAEVS